MSAISRITNFYEFALFDPITMTALTLGGSLASTAIGAGIGAQGTLAAGKSAQQLGQFQQAEAVQQGETATATAQRQMLEQQRQTGLVQSTLQARAAGNGGTATAPSVLNLSRNIAGRGEYNALMGLSQGEDQQAGLINQGDASAYSGDLAKIGSQYSAEGTLAGGAGSMFSTLSRFKGGYGGIYG